MLVPHPHVRTDAQVLGGSPFVAGTRVPVRRLWSFYKNGTRIDTLMRRFPQLSPAQVFDALAFALDNEAVMEADVAREEELLARSHQGAAARPKGPEQIALPFGEPVAAPRGGARGRVRQRSG